MASLFLTLPGMIENLHKLESILGYSFRRPEILELLTQSKSALLQKFISKAGRPFSAYLVVDDSGKVTFDFPPRDGE